MNILIDTDPGIDDLLAIAYLARHPKIHISGMTSVFGNVEVESTTHNLLYIANVLGLKTDIARGAAQPLFGEPNYAYHVHGENGLGDAQLEDKKLQKPLDGAAANFILEKSHELDSPILLCLGPLTNLALALLLDPSLSERLGAVVFMGGAAICGGNVTPVAEANIFSDPFAAEIVLKSDLCLTMCGLDVTNGFFLSHESWEKVADGDEPWRALIAKSVPFYEHFYTEESPFSDGLQGIVSHDSLAALYLTNPDLFETAEGRLCVAVEGAARGQTLFEQRPSSFYDAYFNFRPAHNVLLRCDHEAAKKVFLEQLNQPPTGG